MDSELPTNEVELWTIHRYRTHPAPFGATQQGFLREKARF
jgi:hypothetical protein